MSAADIPALDAVLRPLTRCGGVLDLRPHRGGHGHNRCRNDGYVNVGSGELAVAITGDFAIPVHFVWSSSKVGQPLSPLPRRQFRPQDAPHRTGYRRRRECINKACRERWITEASHSICFGRAQNSDQISQQFTLCRLHSLGLRPPRMRGVVNCESVIGNARGGKFVIHFFTRMVILR